MVDGGAAATGPARRRRERVLAIVGSCHPLPCVAVVAFVIALTVKAGNSGGTCTLVAFAVLAGQLSIGWSNDLIDAARDRTSGRTDKPLARDSGDHRTVTALVGMALVATGVASVLVGARFAMLHLGAVGCGWLYNLGLKSTWWSWLPYALAFGSLPALATAALPIPRATAWWAVTAGALLGCTAHIANTLPDVEDDRRTGVLGVTHRLGPARATVAATLALLAGTTFLVLGPAQPPSAARRAGFVIVALWAGLGTVGALHGSPGRGIFLGAIAVAALDLALLLAGPGFIR